MQTNFLCSQIALLIEAGRGQHIVMYKKGGIKKRKEEGR